MVGLSCLDRKMLRDLGRMRGQAVAIGFVILAGVAAYVSMAGTMHTLQRTLDRYYADYAFADGFASVRRAPESAAERIRALEGVREVETRVVAMVHLDVPGFPEPVSGLVVSVPEGRPPVLNRLHIRKGRLPLPDREQEVVLNQVFAEAHGLVPDDEISAVIHGRRRTLRVVGIALSPEHLMQVQPGVLFPDPERFGVLWMGRAALEAALDMGGAFNDLTFRTRPGLPLPDVIRAVDLVLDPYGGRGAHDRDEQGSHRMITEEFRQLEGITAVLPLIFLGVAASLLNIVVTRLIGLQRDQIGILKAFGYRNAAIGWHFVKLVLTIALAGTAAGIALGAWAGHALATFYLEYFRFPYLHFALPPSVLVTAVLLTSGASLLGVLRAVGRAVRLPPAEAMRPAPPAAYRPTAIERLGLQRLLGQPSRMILRNLERRPVRALLTLAGIACSLAILIMGLFFVDSIDHVVRVQFGLAQREDLAVSFTEPASLAALHELASLPGVRHAEPFRAVPVRLRRGHRHYATAIEGIPVGSYLRRVLDTDLHPVPIPPEGLVLTDRLARRLGAAPGDEITVEVLEGRRWIRRVPVSGITQQYLGLAVYMEWDALTRLTGEGPTLSGAYLLTDPRHEPELTQALRDRPRIAGMLSQERAIRAYFDASADVLLVYTFILSLFAGVIAFGVIYNSIRVSLSERDRELASLRVLGFTRGEVGFVLLGEMALLTLAALPLGMLAGTLGSRAYGLALETDLYQIPVVLTRSMFTQAALVVLGAALLSGLMVRRRLHRLDLVGVLKTRE